jgi:hypothetical protein
MPQMDGLILAQQMRRHKSQVPMIMFSGALLPCEAIDIVSRIIRKGDGALPLASAILETLSDESGGITSLRLTRLDLGVVDITPAPGFSWFVRLHDGVLGVVEVFGGVLIGRAVATADVTANQAHAEVDPFRAGLQTFFAAVSRRGDFLNLGEMLTFHGYHPQ